MRDFKSDVPLAKIYESYNFLLLTLSVTRDHIRIIVFFKGKCIVLFLFYKAAAVVVVVVEFLTSISPGRYL